MFYRTTAAEKISRMITGNTHPRCTLVPYAADAEVETWLRDHLGANPPY